MLEQKELNVCVIHQNDKLKLIAAKLVKLTVNDETSIKNIQHDINLMECNPTL